MKALSDLLVTELELHPQAGSYVQSAQLRTWLMICFAYLFGWRASTVERLKRQHMHLELDGMVVFMETFCKRFQKLSENAYRTVLYNTTLFPGLTEGLRMFLGRQPPGTTGLWDVPGMPTLRLVEGLKDTLAALAI